MTRQNLFALSLGFAAAALIATDARAQGAQGAQCGERTAVAERLASGYGETRQSVGLAANNSMIEVYASDATGTWTIVVTTAAGMTCLVASGTNYQLVAERLPKPGDDA